MNKIVEELKKTGVFYLATVEGDLPRVRPFGAIAEIEGKAYTCTNNTKDVYAQLMKNPNAELCGMEKDGTWVRVKTRLIRDDRDEIRAEMLEKNPSLKSMYHVGDGIFEVLYFENPVCVKYSFTAAPVVVEE
jgi:uncharacterized pyridoxamine 5'-phosphate oxidase family protein